MTRLLLTLHKAALALRPDARRHRARLLALRPARRVAQSLDLDAERLVFDRSDWVSAWVDPRQSVTSHSGLLVATRAITTQGRLLWLVRRAGLARAFHSRADDPFAAMAEAEAAWRRRADQRQLRPQVRAIVRDLRRLRRRMWVCRADAYRSPLCDEGVDAFLRSLGLGRFDCFPGWLIAWLFAFDRQVGFVLYEADQRARAALSFPDDPGASGADPRGRAAPH